jgi:hypothetical protein
MSWKKFLVASDNHGGLICHDSAKKLMDFAKTWKPHYRIHLGDVWDFAPLRGGASQEEKADGIADDYQQGMEFLDAFKPNYLTLGNHDDRIWLASTRCADGILRERCQDLARASEKEFAKRKIQWIPYHVSRFLRMPEGGPKLIHGFRSTMYPAKAHSEAWGEVLHGHCHKPDSHVMRNADGGQAMSVGCIGDIEKMTYADRYPAKLGWRNGFLFGMIHTKTGRWNAWHATKEGADWISPHGIL